MHTEDEAKTKWCPAARVSMGPNRQTNNQDAPTNPHLNCIASACMAWRRASKATGHYHAVPDGQGPYGVGAHRAEFVQTGVIYSGTHGYCGLAGQP